MSERKHQGRQMRLEMRTSASPRQVWDAWTDPEKIAHWFVDRARGKPEVGSTFTWIFDKFGYEIPYEVAAADPEKRFALGGEVPGVGPFLLEILIAKDGGETVVTLVNSGFQNGAQWDEEYEGVSSGWSNALAVLKHYLENYFGRPKTALLLIQPAAYEYDRLLPMYSTDEGLRRWLVGSASVSEVGEPSALALLDGDTITGRMLSKTSREVSLSWKELDAVVELKGFRMGPAGRVVAIRVLSWRENAELAARLEVPLTAALQRLAGALSNGNANANASASGGPP